MHCSHCFLNVVCMWSCLFYKVFVVLLVGSHLVVWFVRLGVGLGESCIVCSINVLREFMIC